MVKKDFGFDAYSDPKTAHTFREYALGATRRRAFARELSIAAHPRSTKDQAASDLSK